MFTLKSYDFCVPHGMIKLAEGIVIHEYKDLFSDIRLPELPPRSIDDLLSVIESGRFSEISVLEWISLLDNKKAWDLQHKDLIAHSDNLIWDAAKKNNGLRYLLYWRLCLHFDNNPTQLSEGLTFTFKKIYKNLISIDEIRTKIIYGISENEVGYFCSLVFKERQSPSAILKGLGLPSKLEFCNNIIKNLPIFWLSNNSGFSTNDIIELAESLTVQDQDLFYDSLLINTPIESIKEIRVLANKIIAIYSPFDLDSRFNRLSTISKSRLKDIIGLMSFEHFSELVKGLVSPLVAIKLGLQDWDIRQLSSRVSFWSNYHKKLLSFHVFIPDLTYKLLHDEGYIAKDISVSVLNEGASEICVLEFDEYYILEFLRGNSSGTRIINKQSLFDNSGHGWRNFIYQGQLESIPYVCEHDHVIFWQKSCEKMLREVFKITPNEELKKFLISEKTPAGKPFYQNYSFDDGLPLLTREQISKREEALNKLRKNIGASRKLYLSDDPIYSQLIDEIINIFSIVLEKHKCWIGYSRENGWVYLDRRLSQNIPSSKLLKLYILSEQRYIQLDKKSWVAPQYLWGPVYFEEVIEFKRSCMKFFEALKGLPNNTVVNEFNNVLNKLEEHS